jgi:TraM recognition site of TraD and TraG
LSQRPIPYKSLKSVLLLEVGLPILVLVSIGLLLDFLYWKELRHYLVSLPTYGPRLQATKAYAFLYDHHTFIVAVLPTLLFTAMTFQAQAPGPGLALLRLLGLGTYPLFPPIFSYRDPKVLELIQKVKRSDPSARVIGFYKRFTCDIEEERRAGLHPGTAASYWPIILREKTRYRHAQVVGSTGSGKSASTIAPLLFQDAMAPNLSTFTINPKSDTYLIKCVISGVIGGFAKKGDRPPTALISMVRPESLAYDPLAYGDADVCTKKIIGSMEFDNAFYRGLQETWLLSFFRVLKTEPALEGQVMLKHLHGFLVNPGSLREKLGPLVQLRENQERIEMLAAEERKNLAGVAAHVAGLVEDESLSHIFNNPDGHYLDMREVIRKGGNVFIEVDTNAKASQSRALGRMLVMELQLFASARQSGKEPSEPGVMAYIDEFASFVYNDFIGLLDKSRSAKVGFLLAHQTIGNFEKNALSRGFKSEVIDNCRTKILLDIRDETARWGSQLLGEQRMALITETIGSSKDHLRTTSTKNKATREEYSSRAVADHFNLPLGHGFGQVEAEDGRLVNCPLTVGYLDETDLCSDAEMAEYLVEERTRHPMRTKSLVAAMPATSRTAPKEAHTSPSSERSAPQDKPEEQAIVAESKSFDTLLNTDI